ncbi:unnamed protein product [Ixodes hexagonus]
MSFTVQLVSKSGFLAEASAVTAERRYSAADVPRLPEKCRHATTRLCCGGGGSGRTQQGPEKRQNHKIPSRPSDGPRDLEDARRASDGSPRPGADASESLSAALTSCSCAGQPALLPGDADAGTRAKRARPAHGADVRSRRLGSPAGWHVVKAQTAQGRLHGSGSDAAQPTFVGPGGVDSAGGRRRGESPPGENRKTKTALSP